MEQIELKDFRNDGFGWKCKHCENELERLKGDDKQEHSRLMREGEAESKNPEFSTLALAKWADAAQTTLICPRCGIVEAVGI